MEGVAQCLHMAGVFQLQPTPPIQTPLTRKKPFPENTVRLPCDVFHVYMADLLP